MFAILKREFKNYLLTPLGYVFIGVFIFLFSLFFFNDIFSSQSINFEFLFYNGSTILTFVVPVLTMRMFAEERKNGTEQLLLTSPRSMFSVVLGKLLAALLIIIITEAFTFMYFVVLSFFGNPSLQVALVTMFGFLLLSLAYLSFGMFASSITENQINAFILSVGTFLALWFLPFVNEIFKPFSLIAMFDNNFPRGIISISDIITFVSFSLLFTLLTIVVLQRKKSVK